MNLPENAEIFHCLSDKNRLRILMMLSIRTLCVCEIDYILDIALSTISANLKLLRNNGLIKDRKEGKWVYYSLNHIPENRQIFALVRDMLAEDPIISKDRDIVKSIDKDICKEKNALDAATAVPIETTSVKSTFVQGSADEGAIEKTSIEVASAEVSAKQASVSGINVDPAFPE